MPVFKQFDLALAKFKDYPPWPVIIIKVGREENEGKSTYVFCYGTHEEYRLLESNLSTYDTNASVNPSQSVKKAFAELSTSTNSLIQV